MAHVSRARKAPAVFDSQLQQRHAAQKRRDKAVARTRDAFMDKEGRRKAASADMVEGGLELHSDVIMRRLMKLNKNLYFEVANADKNRYGIYLLDPGAEVGRQFICGMPRGICREYTTYREDPTTGDVRDIVPGWRTVLARLVQKRLISEPRAIVMFGTPAVTSKRWQRALYE